MSIQLLHLLLDLSSVLLPKRMTIEMNAMASIVQVATSTSSNLLERQIAMRANSVVNKLVQLRNPSRNGIEVASFANLRRPGFALFCFWK